MKTVSNETTRKEIISRIGCLGSGSVAEWGHMNVYQMLKHCRMWEEMALGRRSFHRHWIGRIFGRIALRSVLKDETPLRRHSPTVPELRINGDGDIDAERTSWIVLLQQYVDRSDKVIVHPFFGKMTREQVALMSYKHADHHLRQFNC